PAQELPEVGNPVLALPERRDRKADTELGGHVETAGAEHQSVLGPGRLQESRLAADEPPEIRRPVEPELLTGPVRDLSQAVGALARGRLGEWRRPPVSALWDVGRDLECRCADAQRADMLGDCHDLRYAPLAHSQPQHGG